MPFPVGRNEEFPPCCTETSVERIRQITLQGGDVRHCVSSWELTWESRLFALTQLSFLCVCVCVCVCVGVGVGVCVWCVVCACVLEMI